MEVALPVSPENVDQVFPNFVWFHSLDDIRLFEFTNAYGLPNFGVPGQAGNQRMLMLKLRYFSTFTAPVVFDDEAQALQGQLAGTENTVGVFTLITSLAQFIEYALMPTVQLYESAVQYVQGKFICKVQLTSGDQWIAAKLIKDPFGKWNMPNQLGQVPEIRLWNEFADYFVDQSVSTLLSQPERNLMDYFEDYDDNPTSIESIEFVFMFTPPGSFQYPLAVQAAVDAPVELPAAPPRVNAALRQLLAGCTSKTTYHPRVVSSFPRGVLEAVREVVEVPSQNNNCLLAVLRYAIPGLVKKHGNIVHLYKFLRKAIEIPMNEKIPISACEKLAILLDCSIQVYDENDTSICFFNSAVPKSHVEIKIIDEHAYWIRQKKFVLCQNCGEQFQPKGFARHQKGCLEKDKYLHVKCIDCGRDVRVQRTAEMEFPEQVPVDIVHDNHVCNAMRVSFYQRKILEKANEYVKPIVIPKDREQLRKVDPLLFGHVQLMKDDDEEAEQEKVSSVWRYVAEKKLYCFDLETFPDKNDSSSFIPYAVGTYFSEREGDKYMSFYGEDCMEKFVEDLIQHHKTGGIKTILAFNGRNFDFHFLVRYLSLKGERISDVILKGSSISRFKWGKTVTFDLNAFFACSLSALCKEFNVSSINSKASFPHDFMTSFEKLSYVGPIPEARFWGHDSVPVYADRETYYGSEEIADRIWPIESVWNLYEHSAFYLEKDVMGLVEVYSRFARQVYDLLNLNVNFYISAPQLAYDMFRTTAKKFPIALPPNEVTQNFFQQAVYGGRVYPRKPRYISTGYDIYKTLANEKLSGLNLWIDAFEEFEKRVNEQLMDEYMFEAQYGNPNPGEVSARIEFMLQDYLYDMDVVSLYPTAMLQLFPCGLMYCLRDEDLALLTRISEATPEKLRDLWDPKKIPDRELDIDTYHPLAFGHGIFCVDVEPNTSLLEPVLPRRNDNSKSHKEVVWDLQPIKRGVYTSIDLFRAYRCGYKVTKFYSGIVWAGMAPVLREHVLRAKSFKEEGDKDPKGKAAMRSFGKLILNATYGKFLQRPVYTTCDIVSFSEICPIIMQGNVSWEDICVLDKDQNLFIVSTEKIEQNERDKQLGKPTYLGAFVLSYSRLIMDEIYEAADPCRNCVDYLPYYGDTDSLIMPRACYDRLKYAGKTAENGNKRFGSVSNDISSDARIIRGYFVSPKVYAVEYITKDGSIGHHMRAKGIPSKFMEFEMYDALDIQREHVLKNDTAPNDELVKIYFRTFLKTGFSERSRLFTIKDFVAPPLDQNDAHLLNFDDFEVPLLTLEDEPTIVEEPTKSVEEANREKSLSYPQRTRQNANRTLINPCSILYLNTARSLSGSVWKARDFNFECNYSVPKGFMGCSVKNCST